MLKPASSSDPPAPHAQSAHAPRRMRTMGKVFEGINEQQQRRHEEEAARRYGAETVAATAARWSG